MADLVQIRRGGETPGPRPDPTGDGPRVYLETLGCQMNEADSALIMGQLARDGYVRVTDPASADVILINTCAVREKAEDRVYGRTSQLSRHQKDNPDLLIGITGCMAEHLREAVTEKAPHIGLVAGPDAYRNIAALVGEARGGARVVDVHLDKTETYEGLDGVPDDDGISGFVSIQRGCDKFCTFCVVPYTRGRERGVAPREILRQVRGLVDRGYREVVLLGQTVNSYCYEDVDFADLVRAVATTEGVERLRFTSPYPVDFSDKLIATMAELDAVCPQVHLPVQSGSDPMLTAMKRGYTRDQFVRLVDALRTAIPGIALSTDIMVGFCGETEEDHAQTLDLMRAIRFDSAFMFRYSDRGITQAARTLNDDVPDEVKARRLQDVIALQEEHGRAAHEAWVGAEVDVLISGPSKRGDRLTGRTPHFHNVLLPLDAGTPGQTIRVRIGRSTGHSLVAG